MQGVLNSVEGVFKSAQEVLESVQGEQDVI